MLTYLRAEDSKHFIDPSFNDRSETVPVQNDGYLLVGTKFSLIVCTVMCPNEHQNPGKDWNNSTPSGDTRIVKVLSVSPVISASSLTTHEGIRKTWKVSRILWTLITFSQTLYLDQYQDLVWFSWQFADFLLIFFYPTNQKVQSKIESTGCTEKKSQPTSCR